MKLLIISTCFLINFLESLMYSISHLKKKIVSLLTFLFVSLLQFPYLALLFWLVLWLKYWKGVRITDTPVSFLTFVELLQLFYRRILALGFSYTIYIMLKYVPSSVTFSRTVIMKTLDDHVFFLFQLICDLLNLFTGVCWTNPTFKDKAKLIMM